MAASTVFGETMSVESFLSWETEQTGKHYLHQGRVYAMAGASRNHGSITPALTEMCRRQLRGKTCRYRDDDTKVVVAETGATYYPDGLIACPPRYVSDSAGAIDNPTVVFEVLSPSTKNFDREDKFDAYRRLESLRDYVLIASETMRVEVFSRRDDGTWSYAAYLPGSVALVPSVGLELELEALYEEAVFGDPAPEAA